MNTQIIAIANQKGGVGKTTTCANLGNALAAANRVLIPVQAEYLPAKGLEQLLLTMVDSRTNFAKDISVLLRETYGSKIKVFGTGIPHSVCAEEIQCRGEKHLCP